MRRRVAQGCGTAARGGGRDDALRHGSRDARGALLGRSARARTQLVGTGASARRRAVTTRGPWRRASGRRASARASTTVPRVCRPASPAPSRPVSTSAHRPACRLPATCSRPIAPAGEPLGPALRLRSAPRAPPSRASAGPGRLHGRLQHPRRRDRRGAAARAVLRRLDDRVGEHDRDRARGAVDRLLVRRQARRPQPDARRPVPDRLLAGLLLAVVPFVADPFLGVAVDALDSISAGGFVGSLLGVTVLIATPILVSGAVAPYALRLAVADVARPARCPAACTRSRRSAACSGTWASALLFIPLIGTRRTFVVFGLVLVVIAAIGLARAAYVVAPARRSPCCSRCRSGRSRGRPTPARASSTTPTPSTSTRASCRTSTAPARSSSTRARPCTRSAVPARTSPATTGTRCSCCRSRRARGRRARSRSSATPPARPPARTGTSSRRPASTPSRSTAS